MNRASSFLAGLAMILVLGSCQTLTDGAKEAFSKDFTCPMDRVESRDRPELRRSSFATVAAPTPKPPADIAADPERRAMWEKRHRQDPTQFDGLDDIEEARGCGQQAFYFCHRMRQHANHVTCGRVWTAAPPGISHW